VAHSRRDDRGAAGARRRRLTANRDLDRAFDHEPDLFLQMGMLVALPITKGPPERAFE
jgi:hypothetical protein